MRTAIIGLGRMGQRHVQVVKELGLNLVAVADLNPQAVDTIASESSIGPDGRFDDPQVLIAKIKPQLLVIATTAPSHRDLVIAGAVNGAEAILCEKPMAESLAACDAMLAACEKSGTRLAINHQMRFMEQYTAVKNIVDTSAMGGLGSVTVTAGNFGMAMNGTHYFEMFRYITGEAPQQVAAWFSDEKLANPRGDQFEDAAGCVRLVTPSGKRFYMDCSADQGHGMYVTYTCRNGRISVDELAGTMEVVTREAEHSDAPTNRYGMPYTVERRDIAPADAVAPTKAVLEALLKGEDYPHGKDGRLAMAGLIAAHRSVEQNGASVNISGNALSVDKVLPIA